jgi:phosphoserine phosphatase
MKLVAFDMDGTLLRGRTILFLAEEFGFYDEAVKIIESDTPKIRKSERLAGKLKGIYIKDFMEVIKKIPLTKGASEAVKELRALGWKTAIITDSYQIVADYFREKLGIDRAAGLKLLMDGERITGRIEMPWICKSRDKCLEPSICKKEILKAFSREFKAHLSETVAIGDNQVDICMVKEAGLGIAFNPKVKELETAADVVIKSDDLREVLKYITLK